MGLSEFQSPSQKPGSAACTTLPGLGRLKSASTGEKIVFLNNLTTEVGGVRHSRGSSPRGCPRFAVTPTTKSLLTQPLYGEGRNPPPSEPPELALGDSFSGLNDYDTGVKPGCYSSWNGLTDPFRGVGLFLKIGVQEIQTSHRIAVDPTVVVIFTQSYAALPKFVLDKLTRQQIVLRGLDLLWRYDFYQQTGAFSLACELSV